MTGFMVFLVPGTSAQILISLMMAFFSLFVYSLTKPFSEDFNNYLAIVAHWQLVLTLVATLALRVNLDNTNLKNMPIFDYLLTGFQFIPALLLVFFSFLMAKRRRKDDESGGTEEKQEERNPSVVPIIDGEEGDIELGEIDEGKGIENEKEDSKREASETEVGSQKKEKKDSGSSEERVKMKGEKEDGGIESDQYLDKDDELLRKEITLHKEEINLHENQISEINAILRRRKKANMSSDKEDKK
eukprot:CAMPEP_0118646000 /NCGR_PEP_ID=MMETSP0785-20121206/7809_1 /TAXON_ID=91992 /ORGANISM="Bolidomonas pacifica, Strain CCMP 1866" /LENGTH=243 /DNA_ID=CAMNT_0006537937 /DNA_START=1 /DNA_END=732 /DNA_ORIENTATION=+